MGVRARVPGRCALGFRHPLALCYVSQPLPPLADAPSAVAPRGGPFRPGDRVQLTDPKRRHYTLTLETGGQYHTHRGGLAHDDLIGKPEGSVVISPVGTPYLA